MHRRMGRCHTDRQVYLDLHKVDRLHEAGLCGQHTGIKAAPGCGDDLATTSVDGISVQSHIMNIESHTTHVLLTESALRKESWLVTPQ